MFLNISSDYVQIIHNNKEELIHRNEVDKELGPKLVKINRDHKIDKIFILNGPGGFTNLRVGTLCINLLNTLLDGKIMIYETTKFSIFNQAYLQKILPNRGVIYIGQKQNLRHYDLKKQNHQAIKKSDIPNLDKENLFFDLVFDKEYYEPSYQKNMIKLEYIGNGDLKILFQDKVGNINLQEISSKVNGNIEPKYFVEPIISKPKKK